LCRFGRRGGRGVAITAAFQQRCCEFREESNSHCSTCITVGLWAKQDKTVLHEIVTGSSAKMPFLDRFLGTLDERKGRANRAIPQ
jgi:hypothetical protein